MSVGSGREATQFKPGNPGAVPGRKPRVTVTAKQLLLDVLKDLGGRLWLAEQARQHPVAFMGLIGRLIPIEANVRAEVDITITEADIDAARERIERLQLRRIA